MIRSTITTVLVLLAFGSTPVAHADTTQDDQFLHALQARGLAVNADATQRDGYIRIAHAVCDDGKTGTPRTANLLHANGIDPLTTVFILTTAASVYCADEMPLT